MASLVAITLTAGAGIRDNGINFLLIVADDMNYNSVGSFGCPVPGTTPNIDALAAQGIRFTNAHVNSAVSMPSRGAIMTGMYGFNSGVEGFEPMKKDVPTLTEHLRLAGYLTGVMGKANHSLPKYDSEFEKFDLRPDHKSIGFGKNPRKYYQYARTFFQQAKDERKPFFLMANSHDPHRPFAGSDDEKKNPRYYEAVQNGDIPDPSKIFDPGDIVVPGFLPDLPDIRKEIAQYYSSVRRCDDMVGELLRALSESGMDENTLVIFISDNGMPFPYAKTNCYLNSTKTPFIARWPGNIKQSADSVHFISGIDFLPTFLEAAGIPVPDYTDGRSFLTLLKGKTQQDRKKVFTQFYETSGRNRFPMRAVQNHNFGYIFNIWSDGHRIFKNESQNGLTFRAMKESARACENIRERVDFFLYRSTEEFYDFTRDPDALVNLIHEPAYQDEIRALRAEMETWMRDTADPALEAFRNRYIKEAMQNYMETERLNPGRKAGGNLPGME